MEKIKISALQMHSELGCKSENIEKVRAIIKRDIKDNQDIIVLPEVWNVGWAPELFRDSSENIGDWKSGIFDKCPTLKFLSDTAKEYGSWIIGGSIIIKEDNDYYNTCPVFNRMGELVCTYSKNHLFSYYGCAEGKFVKRGNSPVLVNIEGVKTGLSICYDIRFPELYRAYRKSGADLLINCAAWGLNKPIPWECMTRSRAVEEQTYMIALTQSGYVKDDVYNIGHSRIIDYKGETISEIKDQKEGIMNAVLDLKEMYEFRDKCRCIDDIKENYEVMQV